jgi:hypothetical protein
MRLVDFPPWMRAMLAVTVILLFFEVIFAIAPITAFLTTWSWKVDPGLAALDDGKVVKKESYWKIRQG